MERYIERVGLLMFDELQNEFCALRDKYIEAQFGRLNAVQKEAVFTINGPLLILAGAGSGKTTVLVNRIANIIRFGTAHGSKNVARPVEEADLNELEEIIKTGAKPSRELAGLLRENTVRAWNVMAITFTNKAAGELKERLENMLEGDGSEVFASTFHSACVRILRRYAEQIGYPQSFTIYDTDDAQRVMKAIYKEFEIDDKFLPVKSALSQIGRLKDKLISVEDALAESKDSRSGIVARVYAAYQKRLRDAGAFDFDDLIYQTVMLLIEHPEVREFYRSRYRYLLVDEYQDTSVAQFELVRLLTNEQQNICVVGDDDQSIYRFRGATIENILSFEERFIGAKTIKLEENYRSTSNILNAANAVIANNFGRKGKTLWTNNGDGEKIQHYQAENETDEAKHIVEVIAKQVSNGAKLSDFAVLYRMNAQSAPLETYFTRAGIPHKILGGQRFNDREEVKDIHSYLSIIANRKDDLRLRRIINKPVRKIGATTIDNVAEIAQAEGVSMLDICARAAEYAKISRAAVALLKFYAMYEKLCELAEDYPLDIFVTELIKVSGYQAMLETKGEEGEERLQNLGQLVNNMKHYMDARGADATLAGYLEEIALISDLDQYNQASDQVVMMTMHSAKGLEFPYVFLPGFEDGVFPGERAKYAEEDMEEERRLCYVGITRAKKELYISSSVTRMIFGQTKRNKPSGFLEEIGEEYLERTQCRALEIQNRLSSTGGYGMSNYGGASGFSGASSYGGNTNYGGSAYGARNTANNGKVGEDENGYPAKRPEPTNRQVPTPAPQIGRVGVPAQRAQSTAKPIIQFGAQAKPTAAKLDYKINDIVEHKIFGKGIIKRIAPTSGDAILEIHFEKVGMKKTMANYAPLTKIK